MKKTLLSLAAVSIVALSFNGCGGGDSASGDKTSTVSFPENAVAAEATPENADKVADTVVTDPSSLMNGLMLNSVSNEKVVTSVQLLKQSTDILNKSIKEHSVESIALNETVNESWECSNGGSINYSGSGSDTTGGTVTITYNQCNEYSTIMNGKIQVVIADYNSNADQFTTTKMAFLTDFEMSSDYISFSYQAGSYINQTVNTFSDTGYGYMFPSDISVDTSYIATMNEMKFGLKDCKFNFKYADYYSDLEFLQSQGRIYISNDLTAYVDVDTSYDPAVHYYYEYGTLASGEGHYLMADNTPLTITATGGGSYTTTIGD